MAGSPSSSLLSLHAHACLVGEPHRVFLQYPQQAGFGAQRPAFQAGTSRNCSTASWPATTRPVIPSLGPKAPNPCNESSRPPRTIRLFTPRSLAVAEPNESKRFYKELMGRCTSAVTTRAGGRSANEANRHDQLHEEYGAGRGTLDVLAAITGMRQVPVEDRTKFLSDHGSGYMARVFEEYLRMLAIRHIYCAPHHPQTNGKIERFHETLKARMNLLVYTSPDELRRTMQDFIVY